MPTLNVGATVENMPKIRLVTTIKKTAYLIRTFKAQITFYYKTYFLCALTI